MAASLPGMFVVASSYLVRGLQLFNPKRVVNSILHTYPMLKTYKKYCNWTTYPIILSLFSNGCQHVTGAWHTCCDCVASLLWQNLYFIYTFNLWEWSYQWRISSLITSSSLKYPLSLKLPPIKLCLSHGLSLGQFWTCLHWAPRTNTELEKFSSMLFSIYMSQIFSD